MANYTKISYPNISFYSTTKEQDIEKWKMAAKNFRYLQKLGNNHDNSLQQATAGWTNMERQNFLNWLKFYEEGNDKKYARAQYLAPGYYLPKNKNVDIDENPIIDIEEEDIKKQKELEAEEAKRQEEYEQQQREEEKQQIIKTVKQKIISRLQSLQKLVSSDDAFHVFEEQEEQRKLLEIIHELMRKFMLINKKSSSVKTYEDLIMCQAKSLNKNGFVKSANILYNFAQYQLLRQYEENPNNSIIPQTSHDVQNVDAPPPPAQQPPASPAPLPEPIALPEAPQNQSSGVFEELNKKIQQHNYNDVDTKKIHKDINSTEDDLIISEADIESHLMSFAQEAPKPIVENKPVTPSPVPTAPKQEVDDNIEIDEGTKSNSSDTEHKNFDAIIDSAMNNLKVEDVIHKLEDLVKIFKTREVGRQFALIDLMLDRLGLIPYFPALAEATRSTLESNQYCLTRLEEILSKLQGTIETNDIDLTHQNEVITDPKLIAIKDQLQEEQDKEKERKNIRKQVENKKLDNQNKEKPEVEDIESELGNETQESVANPPAAPKQEIQPQPATK